METFSALLAICAGNSPAPGEFPAQRPVTRSFDVLFDLRLNKRLSEHCNVNKENIKAPHYFVCIVCNSDRFPSQRASNGWGVSLSWLHEWWATSKLCDVIRWNSIQIITLIYYHVISPIRYIYFPKNTRSCIENEWCCPRTVNISNVNFTSNINIYACVWVYTYQARKVCCRSQVLPSSLSNGPPRLQFSALLKRRPSASAVTGIHNCSDAGYIIVYV